MDDLIATTFDHAQCSLLVLGLSNFYVPSKTISQAMSTSSLWCDLVGFLVVVFESFNSTNARRLIWLLGPPTVPLMHEWDLRTLHQPDAFGKRNETQVPLRSISGCVCMRICPCITRYMHAACVVFQTASPCYGCSSCENSPVCQERSLSFPRVSNRWSWRKPWRSCGWHRIRKKTENSRTFIRSTTDSTVVCM